MPINADHAATAAAAAVELLDEFDLTDVVRLAEIQPMVALAGGTVTVSGLRTGSGEPATVLISRADDPEGPWAKWVATAALGGDTDGDRLFSLGAESNVSAAWFWAREELASR